MLKSKVKTNIEELIKIDKKNKFICTGGVIFIGGGKTGKTHTALNLSEYKVNKMVEQEYQKLKKSINMEFNYFTNRSQINGYEIKTSSQIFVMPGQRDRAGKGKGFAFEDAADYYFEVAPVKAVIALVLTYDLTKIKTFQNLQYWLNRAIERQLFQPYTNIILLGTHLDHKENIVINMDMIKNAKRFIKKFIKDKTGKSYFLNRIHTVFLSNTNKVGLDKLKKAIDYSFHSVFKLRKLSKRNIS